MAAWAVTALCGQALAGGANVPDWVRQAAAQPLGNYPAETKAVVLLNQTDYTVTAPGEYVEHLRWVMRILRPEGREEGDLAVALGQKEKLNYARAWSIDRAAHEYELKQKDFTEKSLPSFELYSDIRFLTAKAPAADPGSVIAFEHEVVGLHIAVDHALAVQVADVLRGKNKPIFTPHLDAGDFVVVINAEKVRLTGAKETDKLFMTYSGWKGGEKYRSVADIRAKHPEKLITHAVKGMIPKNRLGDQMLTKLKVYKGDKHPHAAQQPATLALSR
jgi:large subunit ribosomal protein L13